MPHKIPAAVWRAYRETEEYVGVLIKASVPQGELAGAISEVVDFMQASSDPADRMTPVEFQPTMSGPAVILTDVVPDDVEPALARIAALLAERGVDDVTMTAMPTTNPFRRGGMAVIQAWMGLRGARPPGWTLLRWPHPHWAIDRADLDAALEQLVGWALALPSTRKKVAVASEASYVPVPPEAALPMARRVAALRRRPLKNQVIVTGEDGRMRWVELHHWDGSVSAVEGVSGDAPLDWRAAVSDVRNLVAEAGVWCSYAHVIRAVVPRFHSPDNGDRHVGKPWSHRLGEERELIDSGTLYDAYGIMRLPEAFAESLPLEPDWTVTELDHGAILAEHRDLESWYGARRIRPETIASARARLGDAVIDRTTEKPDITE